MKKCYTCQAEKPILEFNKNKSRKDGLNSICKDCSKQRSKKYYTDNKVVHKQNIRRNTKRYVAELKEWINFVIRKNGCSCCFEKAVVCLEFHHVIQSEKEDLVSKLIHSNSRTRLVEELNKCAIVCSNCHRKIHAGLIPNPIDKKLSGVRLPDDL